MITVEIWVFGVCFGLLGVLWGYSMRNISLQIASATQGASMAREDWSEVIDEFKELVPSTGGFDPSTIADQIQDAIEDAMGNVQMPTALDHIAGFATMFLQNKILNSAPPVVAAGLNALNEHGTESFTHGETTQGQEI